MTNWKVTIDISDIWSKYSEEELECDNNKFLEIRNEITSVLRAYKRKINSKLFEDLVIDLEKSINIDSFNRSWNLLYDWADDNKVWISTI